MSLINDALKKAQKLQMQGQAPPPLGPGGAPPQPAASGRDRSMPGQIFLLMAFGAGVLIALSVLATVYLLRQPAAPVVAQAPAVPGPTGAAEPIGPEKRALAPVVRTPPPAPSLPAVSQPALSRFDELKAPNQSRGLPNGPNPSSGPAPAQNSAPAPAPPLDKWPATPPTPAPALAVGPAPPPASPALGLPAVSQPALSLPNGLDPTKPDPKILTYLDALQIAGVRVSDTGSKVLMNDRVFRENEIVDHLLGLRLKKVDNDTLTFIDERGVIYTKNL